MLTESGLQKYCVQMAKKCGILIYKFASPSQRGVPDLLLVYGGHTTYLELKSPSGKGRLSPLQKREHAKLAMVGVHVYVAETKEEVNEVISRIL